MNQERRRYAGSVEQTTSYRAPTPAPRSRIRGVVRRPWTPSTSPVIVKRDGKAVSKPNAKLIQKAHTAVSAILATVDPVDLLDDALPNTPDGTGAPS